MDRDFKGIWIPAWLWLSEDLNMNEKILLVEIDSLDNSEGCFATNQYFSKILNISERMASEYINNLIKKGYVKLLSFNGRKRVLKCFASVQNTDFWCEADRKGVSMQSRRKLPCRVEENFHAEKTLPSYYINNTLNNNREECLANNTQKESAGKRFKKPTADEVSAYCAERDNGINAEMFIDFYESKGWLIGKTPMKDWKAAVRTWERNNPSRTKRKEYTDAREITEF